MDLIGYEFNNKKHPQKQIDLIANSIKEFGFKNPVIIDKNNILIAGHGRLEGAKKLGLKEVPCIIADDLTDEQIKKYRILDNRLGDFAQWDIENLELELKSLDDKELNLLFDDLNLDLGDGIELNEDKEDCIPEEPKQIFVDKGDIFQLGEHRLMCGDSTNIEDVEQLMNKDKVDMIFTDPPYGMNAVSKSGVLKARYGTDILGDDNSNVAIDSFTLCLSLQIEKMIFWGANYYPSILPESGCWIVWDKNNGLSDQADAELAWTNFKGVVRKYTKASEKTNRVHPTQKPIELITRCFERWEAGKLILDLFGGSGSTLIACEKTNRIGYLMELDEKYIQVIIKRYNEYTKGQKEVKCLNRDLDINQILNG